MVRVIFDLPDGARETHTAPAGQTVLRDRRPRVLVIRPVGQDELDLITRREASGVGPARNGPIGRVNLRFDGQYTKFENLARSPQFG